MTSQSLQSRHIGTSPVLLIVISCPVIFSWISATIWTRFPFTGDFSFGKRPKLQGTKSVLVARLSHLGDLMFHQKTAWDVMHEGVLYRDEAANHQLPRAVAFWIIWIVSTGECSCLPQNLFADSLLYSLCHFECNSHTAHMLTQWCLPPPLTSTVKLSLFMHAHSSPLSLAARLHWCGTNASKMVENLLKVIHILEGLQQAEHLRMLNLYGLQSTKIGNWQCES